MIVVIFPLDCCNCCYWCCIRSRNRRRHHGRMRPLTELGKVEDINIEWFFNLKDHLKNDSFWFVFFLFVTGFFQHSVGGSAL